MAYFPPKDFMSEALIGRANPEPQCKRIQANAVLSFSIGARENGQDDAQLKMENMAEFIFVSIKYLTIFDM